MSARKTSCAHSWCVSWPVLLHVWTRSPTQFQAMREDVPSLRTCCFRYQDNADKLQVDNIKLEEELETQKLNLRDINEFLTNELKARSLTTSALEAKVFELNSLMEDVRKAHEVRGMQTQHISAQTERCSRSMRCEVQCKG